MGQYEFINDWRIEETKGISSCRSDDGKVKASPRGSCLRCQFAFAQIPSMTLWTLNYGSIDQGPRCLLCSPSEKFGKFRFHGVGVLAVECALDQTGIHSIDNDVARIDLTG